jgi:hypothetical protein
MTGAERVRRHRERQRQAQAQRQAEPEAPADAKPKTLQCSFCAQSQNGVRLWGDTVFGSPLICERCVKRAVDSWVKVDSAAAEPEPETTSQAEPTPKAAPSLDELHDAFKKTFAAEQERWARECAIYGGRPRSRVVSDIEQLLRWKGHLADDAVVREAIINAMLPHVAQQANIERGIPRRTFRKVWGDLLPPHGKAANTDAYIAFTGLDATVKINGEHKRSPDSIVVADDKVTTMAEYWRKVAERSAKAKAAAAAKRKAAQAAR